MPPQQPAPTPPPNNTPLPEIPKVPEFEQPTPPPPQQQPKKMGKFGKSTIFFIVLGVLAAGLITTCAVLGLIAYDKIPLQNAKAKAAITKFVMSIPFTPKTPSYVITSTVEAHREVASGVIDASIASGSDTLASFLEGSQLDLAVSGAFDLNNIDDPKAEFNIKMSQQVDLDVKTLNDTLFFRINSVPQILAGFISGLSEESFTNIWVSYDISKLETEARDLLEEDQKSKEEKIDDLYSNVVLSIFNDRVLPKVKMSKERLDENDNHKLALTLSKEDLVAIYQDLNKKLQEEGVTEFHNSPIKQSDIPFSEVNVEMWIDDSTYYMRKLVIRTSIETGQTPLVLGDFDISKIQSFAPTQDLPDTGAPIDGMPLILPGPDYEELPSPPPPFEETIEVVLVINLSQVGEEIQINEPQDALPFEDFIEKIFSSIEETDEILEEVEPEEELENPFPTELPPVEEEDAESSGEPSTTFGSFLQ